MAKHNTELKEMYKQWFIQMELKLKEANPREEYRS